MDFFPYTLNAVINYRKTMPWVKRDGNFQFPEAGEVLEFFVEQLERDQQKTIFNVQASSINQLPISRNLPEYFKDRPNITFYDFSKYYNTRDFKDWVHPNEGIGSTKVAERLFDIIVANLY